MNNIKRKLHLGKIIITNDGEPIFNGAVLVENSRIVQVGKKEDFGISFSTDEIINHRDVLICPGFINLHTHLLYSNFNQINQIKSEKGLFPWLEKLVDKTSNLKEEDYKKSVNCGISQALSTGTTFIVENTPDNISIQELSKSPLKALIGLEVFGSDEEQSEEIFQSAILNFQFLILNSQLEFTLSPHAPYDVSKTLWEKIKEWSDHYKKPILTHLEESKEEKLWWQKKSGPAIDFWRKINKLEPKLKYWKKYSSGIDFLESNDLLVENIIATHLCQATKDDLIKLKKKNIKLVHSPRSNYYLNNGTANLKLWTELGFLWGVGTDSNASNENLDLLEESRFMIKEQNMIYDFNISSKEAFCAITSKSAKILNKESEIGSLKKGCFADFLIYSLNNKSLCTYQEPYNLLISDVDNKKDLKEVWISGQRAWIAEHLLHKI